VLWTLQHRPSTAMKLGVEGSGWDPEEVRRTREAAARTTAEHERKKSQRAELIALREADRRRARLAGEQASEAATRRAQAHEARLRAISAQTTRLPSSPSSRAPQMPDTTAFVRCPHGMEKASCAYCGHWHR
jgi:hypothetical protein